MTERKIIYYASYFLIILMISACHSGNHKLNSQKEYVKKDSSKGTIERESTADVDSSKGQTFYTQPAYSSREGNNGSIEETFYERGDMASVTVKNQNIYLNFADGTEQAISDYDPYSKYISKESMLMEDSKNTFDFKIDQSNMSVIKKMTSHMKFNYGMSVDSLNFGRFRGSTSGSRINKNRAIIGYNIELFSGDYSGNYALMVGNIGTIQVIDQHGINTKTISINDIGFSGNSLSDDGEYILTTSGGRFNHVLMQNEMRIYQAMSGVMIFRTTILPDTPNFTPINNYFTIFIDRSDASYTYGIFYPEKRMFYSLEIDITNIQRFKEWKDDGIHLKDGSAYLFERDFKRLTFDEYNETNLFSEFENENDKIN